MTPARGTYLAIAAMLLAAGCQGLPGGLASSFGQISQGSTNATIQVASGSVGQAGPVGSVVMPEATSKVLLAGNLEAQQSTIALAGVIQGNPAAGTPSPASPVDFAVRILDSNAELISGTLSLSQEGSTDVWDVAFTPDPASAARLASSGTLTPGKLTFGADGTVAQNTLAPLTLTYAPTDGSATEEIAIDPSGLQIRTDVTATRIGFANTLASDPAGSQAAPPGDVGIVYAGGYSMAIPFVDATGAKHAGSLLLVRDLDGQAAGTSAGHPAIWRALFTTQDPTILDDSAGTGAGAGPFPIDLGWIAFDLNGTLTASQLSALTLRYETGAAPSTLMFDPGATGSVAGLTQYPSGSTAQATD